jgi:hypothetical protein
MTSNKSLDQLTKRPLQYWFEDGIGELITGALFILIGIYFILQDMVTNSVWQAVISLLSVIVIGGGVILGRGLIAKLKERLVYPRTGYISYPKRPSKGKLVVTLITVIAVAISIIMLGRSDSDFNWTTLVIGAICGVLMLFQAIQTGFYRLYIEAALSFLLGAMIASFAPESMLSSGLFFVIYGLVLVFAGGCALRSYFQKTPPASNEEEI